MAEPDEKSKRRGVSLPGQPTEEALAEVGSAAGKSLLRGLARLGNAYVDNWATTKEAKAHAARLAIDTESQIQRDKALTAARHESELSELQHQATLHRRLARLRVEMEREQLNLEAIEGKAIGYVERDPNNSQPRELDDDWLFQFAELAQRVSDSDVQKYWARVLASASVKGDEQLSAAALQTLSLFDKGIALDFKKFCAALVSLSTYISLDNNHIEPQGIDMGSLVDLGLVTASMNHGRFRLLGLTIAVGRPSSRHSSLDLVYSQQRLTRRGYEIAKVVFEHETLSLDAADASKYVECFIEACVNSARAVSIPLGVEVDQMNYLVVSTGGQLRSDEWQNSAHLSKLPGPVRALLLENSQGWAIELQALPYDANSEDA